MSYNQWLYRTRPGAGPMESWTENRFEPLGSIEELKQRFGELFPSIRWRGDSDYASSMQSPGCVPDYSVVLSVQEGETEVHMITLRGASQQQAIKLAETLGMCAYDPQKNEQLVM